MVGDGRVGVFMLDKENFFGEKNSGDIHLEGALSPRLLALRK